MKDLQSLEKIQLFDSLTDGVRKKLGLLMEKGTENYSRKFLKRVYEERGLYFLVRGSIRVLNGDDAFLFQVSEGDVFGELEIFGLPDNQKLKLQLLDEVEYLFLPEESMVSLFELAPTIKDNLLGIYKNRMVCIHKPPVDTVQARDHSSADVIMVHGPRGGCGKSLIASNLACELAHRLGKKVLVMDLSIGMSNLKDFFIHESLPNHLVGLLKQDEWNRESVYREYIHKDKNSGVHCLFSDSSVKSRPSATQLKRVFALIRILEKHYDFIVLDTASILDIFNKELIEYCSDILLIMELEYSSMISAQNSYHFLKANHFFNKRFKLLINRSDRAFQMKQDLLLPEMREYVSYFLPAEGKLCLPCLNEGVPVTVKHPNSLISQAFALIGRDYAHIETPMQKGIYSQIMGIFGLDS